MRRVLFIVRLGQIKKRETVMEWLTVMGISVITGIVVAAIATVAALRWDSRQQLAELNEEYRQLVEEMQ